MARRPQCSLQESKGLDSTEAGSAKRRGSLRPGACILPPASFKPGDLKVTGRETRSRRQLLRRPLLQPGATTRTCSARLTIFSQGLTLRHYDTCMHTSSCLIRYMCMRKSCRAVYCIDFDT